MAGQAATKTRDEVRSAIKKVECSNTKSGSSPSLGSMKTANGK